MNRRLRMNCMGFGRTAACSIFLVLPLSLGSVHAEDISGTISTIASTSPRLT